jgi:SNF2 family DNA or RNA helicase
MAAKALHYKPLWSDMNYYEHQLIGIEWMLDKEINGTDTEGPSGKAKVFGGLQCDDMGLGKTIQTMAVLKNNVKRRTLIVAPVAMLPTWIDVAERSGFAVYQVEDGAWTTPHGPPGRKPTVYVAGYERICHSPSLVRAGFDRIVLDEAHKIANPSTLNAIMMRSIDAPLRWALTGTPIINKKRDLISLFAFVGVRTGKLYRDFESYDDLIGELVIHRKMDSIRGIVDNAPPVPIIEKIRLEFASKQEADFYRGIQGTLAHMMRRLQYDILSNQQRLILLMRLRQLSVHPQTYINAMRRSSKKYSMKDWSGTTTKVTALRDAVNKEVPDGNRFLVFCSFTDELNMIKDLLEKDGRLVGLYHGGMTQDERKEVLGMGADVLIVQIQAGGCGLNLQEYNRVVFMSPWWSSALMDQAMARTVRMGQKKVVRVTFYMLEEEASENIDRLIMEKAEAKKVLLNEVLGAAFSG